jgi:hypothetical protein
VLERHGLVCTAGKFDQVQACFLELLAEDFAFIAGETAFGEATKVISSAK